MFPVCGGSETQCVVHSKNIRFCECFACNVVLDADDFITFGIPGTVCSW